MDAMPDSSFLKLSPFIARSRRSFAHGAVGLGIVAALSGGRGGGGGRGRPAAPTRSEPIPIGPSRASAATRPPERDEAELSESYTCVISHVGGNVSKRVYLGDASEVFTGDFRKGRAVLFEPPLPPPKPAMPFPAMDFLSHCYMCKKKLEGIDIYMYRDKAFCSPECRCHQMLVDARRENYGSGIPKLLECCVSPSSVPLLPAAGIAAA